MMICVVLLTHLFVISGVLYFCAKEAAAKPSAKKSNKEKSTMKKADDKTEEDGPKKKKASIATPVEGTPGSKRGNDDGEYEENENPEEAIEVKTVGDKTVYLKDGKVVKVEKGDKTADTKSST
ncbi:unnamed protein product [Bursaphelenchus okinawaensis]|uniref:Uncharacterized protein n=1 Tax=Bursaphelenchus okinawaensis TaxID=465554 RepID=A0A811L7R5_9BILA|nr:unnamed protein product [Bursaphelenchus okinawaensis]CAG9118492.1 unnamed protein product [Bursaphelenchus okinawaensis]